MKCAGMLAEKARQIATLCYMRSFVAAHVGGRNRDGSHRARGNLQRMLWRGLPYVAPHEVRGYVGRKDGAARHLCLARQHRVSLLTHSQERE